MSKTRNGIYYDLKKSEYTADINNIKFYFSSQNNLNKFLDKLEENRDILTYSLYNRFKLLIKANELFDLVHYNKTESRGFYIEVEGCGFDCLESLKLDGVKRISRK